MWIVLGQAQDVNPEFLTFAKQLGVRGVQVNTPRLPGDGYWEYDGIAELVARCTSEGLQLDAIEGVPIRFYDKAMLGLPGRDEQIEKMAKTIRNVGKAGVRYLGYHFMPLSVWRTQRAPSGRGGAEVTIFDAEQVDAALRDGTLLVSRRDLTSEHDSFVNLEMLRDGFECRADKLWDNYLHFAAALAPVAEEAGVICALHPDDPPVSELGGVARILTSPESLERAVTSIDSPNWQVLLCLGTVSEMGGEEAVIRAIRTLGHRRKIAYVHFRDVIGTVPRFQECFLGEGNYDPITAMAELRRAGFDGFVMDDHVPAVIGDSSYHHRARAYAVGYLEALISAARDL
jgi:mannonate dehydratase